MILNYIKEKRPDLEINFKGMEENTINQPNLNYPNSLFLSQLGDLKNEDCDLKLDMESARSNKQINFSSYKA